MYFPSDSWGEFLKEFNQDAVLKRYMMENYLILKMI